MGATSGIGEQLARDFAAKGWTVGAAGRNEQKLRELKDEFPGKAVDVTPAGATAGKVFARQIDITRRDAVEGMEELIEEMGGMDLYCHVAGVGFDNVNLETEAEIKTLEVNAVGFTRMVDTAFRYFRDANGGEGRIAAITSVAGTNGIANMASYSATKAYQQVYLRALRQLVRVEKLKITITDIRPGWIRTPLIAPDERPAMEMQPDYAVKRIGRAVEHGGRVRVVDWRWNLIVGLWRMVPNWLWERLPLRIRGLKSV